MENVDKIKIGDIAIPVAFRNSKQAKRISLRISPARNSVVITLPRRSSAASGLKFLNSKVEWLLANIEIGTPVAFEEGTIFPIFGANYTIKRMEGRGITKLTQDTLEIHCQPEFISRRVKDFIKKQMHEACLKRSQELATRIGRQVTKMSITQTTSRWGSCSQTGAIALNWLLAFAPPKIMDYVIAHEVAHLKEMNHSPRFWDLVEQLHPGMLSARKWLKREGYRLHRYE